MGGRVRHTPTHCGCACLGERGNSGGVEGNSKTAKTVVSSVLRRLPQRPRGCRRAASGRGGTQRSTRGRRATPAGWEPTRLHPKDLAHRGACPGSPPRYGYRAWVFKQHWRAARAHPVLSEYAKGLLRVDCLLSQMRRPGVIDGQRRRGCTQKTRRNWGAAPTRRRGRARGERAYG